MGACGLKQSLLLQWSGAMGCQERASWALSAVPLGQGFNWYKTTFLRSEEEVQLLAIVNL